MNEPKRIKHILDDVTDAIDECNEWEKSFVCGVEEQFRKYGSLTDNQYNKLEEVWKQRCQ